MDNLLEQILPVFFFFLEWKSFLALHSILCSTFAKRIQKKRSGPLSFIPAVLKAQFRLLRLLKSILHKKEWTACYSTIARIAIPIIILLSIWKMWILLGDGIYWSLQEIVFCLPGKSNLKWKIRAQRSVEIWPSFLSSWILVWWCLQGWRRGVSTSLQSCAGFISYCTIGQSKRNLLRLY